MCLIPYTGTKWLKEKVAIRKEMLENTRKQAYGYITTTLEKKSYDCYIAARMEFGNATRRVRITSYSFHLRNIFLTTLF